MRQRSETVAPIFHKKASLVACSQTDISLEKSSSIVIFEKLCYWCVEVRIGLIRFCEVGLW